jgi:hypothetical protein
LWAIGGNNMPDQQPLFLVERIFAPTDQMFLPIIFSNYGENTRPDDHFGIAHPMTPNIAQYRNFDTANDYYDAYYFDLSAAATVTIRLTQIPSGSNYDIGIYTSNKNRIGKGDNLGNLSESIHLSNLSAGRYYVLVSREFPIGEPNTANYRLIVEK